ncbi:MAG: phosphoenolpyruvate---glycerone phosphotransferase subunit DhaK [Clostridiales bacterium]|jgi:dihydroxyacetone kinase-like protein|nr:phosphoenolpyruvate---glycerone phosphotransferase subunit DhaK [Clostridiales bacterium]
MKKIINTPDTVVEDMIAGMVAAHPNLRVLDKTQVLVRSDAPIKDKVGLISGGGSGHEPAHAGYVGKGMLDAACAGDVFTSPAVDQMMAGIRAINSGKGVLIIAKNYTGDNLNFDMAAELLADEGIKVEKVIVKDDVAVEESANTTGRRGIAGTVFVHKIAGAKAELGASLEEVKKAAQKAIDNVRTFGMALSPCIIPSVGKYSFELAEDEIELGTGIHGEAGVKRTSILKASALAEAMLEKILVDLPYQANDEVAVMINGLGSTPLMELYILYNEVAKILNSKGMKVYKSYVGEYMTSLEMAGCSITLLKLDDELKELLCVPADTPTFK